MNGPIAAERVLILLPVTLYCLGRVAIQHPTTLLKPQWTFPAVVAIAIVGAGPSLKETVNRVRDFENVLVCGSGHDFLVRQGIIPNYAAVCDGGKDDKGNLSIPNKETAYLIASQCDPSLFDHLADYHVEMWHYRGQATKTLGEEAELLKGELSIAWGSSIGMIAIALARLIGFQHLHFFGFDSSFESREEHHAYPQPETAQMLSVKVGDPVTGREFQTTATWLGQAQQFEEMRNHWQFDATIYGDSLTAEMERTRKLAIQQKEMA